MLTVLPKGIDMCRKMRAMHMNLSMIAYKLGTSKTTLSSAAKRQPELAEALEAGAGEAEAHLVTSLVRAAYAGFAPAAMFLLKTQHGYRENDTPQTNVNNITLHLAAPISEEELKRLADSGVTPMQLPAIQTEDELEGEVVEAENSPQ